MSQPDENEIQVTFFGPGYGECILVHLGSGIWIIIDSCLNDEREPAAISYLKSIGVDVASDVKAIIATHWHDDHIKGLSKTLEECAEARFALSSVFQNREFLAFMIAHERQPETNVGRGGTEMISCLKTMAARDASPILVTQDRIIASWDSEQLAHGKRVELLALSPSDAQFNTFLTNIGEFFGDVENGSGGSAVTKKRISSPGKNDLSIATILTVGEFTVLLGADVEEHGDPKYGWQNIVDNRRGRSPKPHVFKVAHHGSDGAHLDALWNDVLADQPFSIVTPWINGGKQIPTEDAMERLKAYSGAAYITSTERVPIKKRYSRAAQKLIRYSGAVLETSIFKCGSVTVKIDPENGGANEILLTSGAKKI